MSEASVLGYHYRATSLIGKCPPPKTLQSPYVWGPMVVLGVVFPISEVPLKVSDGRGGGAALGVMHGWPVPLQGCGSGRRVRSCSLPSSILTIGVPRSGENAHPSRTPIHVGP